MQILGIDYGQAKIGLALGSTDSRLAEPWKIIRYKDIAILHEKITQLIKEERIEKVVVGVSDGVIGKESKQFGNDLASRIKIPVEFQDETLTSKDAQRLAIEAGIQRKKRKGMEDAHSAALILQTWLDEQTLPLPGKQSKQQH